MARETAVEKEAREAKVRKAARRKELRSEKRAAAERPAAITGGAVEMDLAKSLEHQIRQLGLSLSELRDTAEVLRLSKPQGVEQLHRRVVYSVFDSKGISIGGSQYDLAIADELTLTVSAHDIAAAVSTGDR